MSWTGRRTDWRAKIPRSGTRRRRCAGAADEPGQDLLPEPRSRRGTKRHLVEYYRALTTSVRPLLDALRDRPTHLQRFPDGIDGEEIYQKRAPVKRPDHVATCTVTFPSGRTADALKVRPAADLVWAAHLGTVTFHPWPGALRGHRHPGRTADRPGPAAGHRFRGGPRGRARGGPAAARRTRTHWLPEDVGRPWSAHVPADRAGLGLHRGTPGRHRVGAGGRAARGTA